MEKILSILSKYKVYILVFILAFALGISVKKERVVEVEKRVEVPVVSVVEKPVEKVVEKIVYKDSPETLEDLKSAEKSACLFGFSYVYFFDMVKDLMDIYGSPIHQDWYDIKDSAQDYQVNCE